MKTALTQEQAKGFKVVNEGKKWNGLVIEIDERYPDFCTFKGKDYHYHISTHPNDNTQTVIYMTKVGDARGRYMLKVESL